MRWLSIATVLSASAVLLVAACGSDASVAPTGPGQLGRPASDAGGSKPDGSAPNDLGPDSGGPSLPPRPVVVTNETAQVGGATRQYLLAVPRDIDPAKSYPVVMSFHGSPSTAAIQLDFQPFDRVSQGDAILVYPQALDLDGTGYSWDLFRAEASNVDMPFIRALPKLLTDKGLKIDTTRIFGYGLSGGAFFLQTFICLRNDFFRAVSTNAGGAPDPTSLGLGKRPANDCPICTAGATATVIIHGQADEVVGAGSGTYAALCQQLNSGCTSTTTATTPASCVAYGGCPVGKPLELCFVPNVNHEPGWSEALPKTWAFFQAQ